MTHTACPACATPTIDARAHCYPSKWLPHKRKPCALRICPCGQVYEAEEPS